METAIFEALDVVSKSKLSETRFDYDITNLAKPLDIEKLKNTIKDICP